MARAGLLGATGVLAPNFLASCAQYSGGAVDDAKLTFDNWPAYIDEETVADFREGTGVDITYNETFNDNNEYFAKVVPSLSRKKLVEPDVIAPTFWMAARMINLEWTQKLPLDLMPNVAENLRSDLRNPVWDPTGEYSVPWQTGMTGLAYNLDATGRELTSAADLLDPEFKGKVGMLTEMRDTIGLILLGQGKDPSQTTTFEQAADAFDALAKAKSDGQIRAFTGNDYLDDLSTGNYAVCVGWSGDVLQIQQDNPSVRFLIPEEGGMSWADTMVWMAGSKRRDAVAAWMDWCYDPEHAAQIADYVQYVPPVEGVKEVFEAWAEEAETEEDAQYYRDLGTNPLLFPDDDTKGRLKAFATLDPEQEQLFSEAFAGITGA